MSSFFHSRLFIAFFFCLASFGHQNHPNNQFPPLPFNSKTQATKIFEDLKNTENEIDEGNEEDAVFINSESKKQLEAETMFSGLKKSLHLKTLIAQVIWKNRIEHPIKSHTILAQRQAIISFLTSNPALLEQLETTIGTISPQVEEALLQLTVDEQEEITKKLYCHGRFIPFVIANTINNNRFLLAAWQIVPHCLGAAITLFDPILHWFGSGGCHGHAHLKKTKKNHKEKQRWACIPLLGTLFESLINHPTQTLKKGVSYLSLAKTTGEAFVGIAQYSMVVTKQYADLFEKAKALKLAIAAIHAINGQLDNHSASDLLIKKGILKHEIDLLVHTINGPHNIGTLPRLQQLLDNKQNACDVKKLLCHLGKLELYISLARAVQNNKLKLCKYTQEKVPSLTLTEAVSPQSQEKSVPNTFIYNQMPTIVTGPGGSGKSEYLAMIVTNIILAQSLGTIPQGGRSECAITPLDYLMVHSNVTDKRGVASTSQIEARRLKEYNEYLKNNPNQKGIIVFDELLKHSNPKSGSDALVALVSFFRQYRLLITLYSTHFEAASEIKSTQQLSTKIVQTDDGEKSTYEIVSGPNNSCSIVKQLSDALGENFVFSSKNG